MIRTLEGHTAGVYQAIYCPNEANIICSCSGDKSIKIFNVVSGLEIKTLLGHTD